MLSSDLTFTLYGLSIYRQLVQYNLVSSSEGVSTRVYSRTEKYYYYIYLSGSIGKIPQSPEAVLNEAATRVAEVHGQGLHAARLDDGGFVAWANWQNLKIYHIIVRYFFSNGVTKKKYWNENY